MTLTNFKNNLKVAVFSVLFLLYTGTIFYIGIQTKSGAETDTNLGKKLDSNAQSTIQDPQGSALSQSARVLSSFVKLCSNTTVGFEVAYPKDWFTTYNNPNSQCMFFAPYSFVLPESTQSAGEITPITITIEHVEEWENTVKLYQNPNDLYSVVDSENLQINGRSAIKVQSTTTGSGSLPRGFRRITYLIFDSNTPTILTYKQLEENADISTDEYLLEDMVSSLKFF